MIVLRVGTYLERTKVFWLRYFEAVILCEAEPVLQFDTDDMGSRRSQKLAIRYKWY